MLGVDDNTFSKFKRTWELLKNLKLLMGYSPPLTLSALVLKYIKSLLRNR